ncbi:hypothetical protein [Flavihumibacter sp. UBA7668]|uniref:hypothetical protein n=1 Tax=Flavihumibacter sp. UBA7668 TaxID=1946542 RepID=UPI0025B9881A|nr:hypothetical protein [Flavihumibacter sp. UBA7668]
MTQDPLKAGWNNLTTQPKTKEAISGMMQEASHPVLKPIRRQLILESIGFTLFLIVYYDFFDGHDKSLAANSGLVTALVLAIAHNLMGYYFARRQPEGATIRESIFMKTKRLLHFAVLSVISRILISAGFLYFFLSVIQLEDKKSWLLYGGLAMVLIQLILLSKIWAGRLRQVREVQAGLNA